ncbi:MAG: SDR family NAD(P)-dependent oxidoreductase, partial [Oscillospiraceae bacterium]|nr:SDR family NAD(P)-dependent oxidoreductase [Oscillospiraceae bacterium]
MDLFNLQGKNVVAVGGAGGIGQAIAQGFVEAGANVIIASRSEASLQRAQEEIKTNTGKTVSYLTVDATDEAS